MNNLLKYVAYGIGGLSLLIGSFVTFSVLTGTPMHEMKAVGGIFPESVTAEEVVSDNNQLPIPEEERSQDVRSPRQVYDTASTPLGAFALQDPFSAEELRNLEERLQRKLDAVAMRARELDQRERELDEERQHVQDLYVEITELRTSLLNQSAENEAASDEVGRDVEVLAEQKAKVYKQMASIFEETEAAEAAAMLTDNYAPKEAAKVLVHLEPERVRELMGAIHKLLPDEGGQYLKALQDFRTVNQ